MFRYESKSLEALRSINGRPLPAPISDRPHQDIDIVDPMGNMNALQPEEVITATPEWQYPLPARILRNRPELFDQDKILGVEPIAPRTTEQTAGGMALTIAAPDATPIQRS